MLYDDGLWDDGNFDHIHIVVGPDGNVILSSLPDGIGAGVGLTVALAARIAAAGPRALVALPPLPAVNVSIAVPPGGRSQTAKSGPTGRGRVSQ